jgi:thiol-disulfide isomerase/thioredoxin
MRAATILLASVASCAHTPAKTSVISMDRLDCVECGDRLAAEVRHERGVVDARFDKRKAELTVIAAPELDALAVARAHAERDYDLVLGQGHGSYLAPASMPPGADFGTVATHGEDVPDVARHLVRGKVTVLDFSAYWCEPCRRVDEHMAELLAHRTDVAYRKLEIVDWDSPLAAHYLKGLNALPVVVVYDREGKRVDVVSGLDLPRLDAAIASGAR